MRNYAIDFIRLVAIIGVVLIHTSTSFTDKLNPSSFEFYVLHFINQFSRFSVPLFFAISGFLLGGKYSEIKSPLDFYKKRLSRIFLPYVTWSFIYFIFIFPHPVERIFTHGFVEGLLRGSLSYQLYFIPTIIVLYAIFPFIIFGRKVFLTKISLAALLIVSTYILSNTYYFRHDLTLFAPFKHAIYNLLPFVVGIYAGLNKVNIYELIKKHLGISLLLFAGLLGLVFSESIYLFKRFNNSLYLRDQWRISVMLYGIAAGGIFYYTYEKFLKKYNEKILFASRYSFGIFFVHVAILHNLMRHVINPNGFFGFISFILSFVFVTGASLLFSVAFSRIKFVDRILGLKG